MPSLPHEVLLATAGHVPEVLVRPEAFGAIMALGRRLPRAFNWLGFECRLAPDDARIDFAGCCEAWNGGRERLVSALAETSTFAGPGPAALIREWADPSSVLFSTSPAIWLEFDFLDRTPVPFAFLCLDPACADTFFVRTSASPPPPEVTMAVAGRGVACLAGRPVPAPLAVLRRSISRLPTGARALHVAMTPHRGGDDLRLHFSLLADDVPSWLAEIGWPGDIRRVDEWIGLLGDDFRQVGVQLTAGERLRPTLGLEFYVRHGPSEFPAWARAFAALASAGVCEPAKARAVFDWWGRSTVRLPSDPCRIHITRQHYLKLSFEEVTLSAKVYLAIFTRNAPI